MPSNPPQAASDRAAALARHGDTQAAYRLLQQAIGDGDGLAAATLGNWRLAGDLIRRDLADARDLFGQAARLGVEDAWPAHTAMLANGAGGMARRWPEALALLRTRAPLDGLARRQIALIDDMALDAEGEPAIGFAAEPMHRSPQIFRIPRFLTGDECRYLVERAMPMLQPSVVVDPRSGALMRDPVRTARSAGFPFVLEDPALHAINRRIAAVTATTYAQGEPLQVLGYGRGEEYKLHGDVLPPGPNQRIMTVLVSLSAGFDGGETHFPGIDLRWKGETGEALVFANVDANGSENLLARHAGLPVTRGTKFLASKWIRQAPLDLSGPPGRPY